MHSSLTGLASLTLLAAAFIAVPASAQTGTGPNAAERDRVSRRCASTSATVGASAPCPGEVIIDSTIVAPRGVRPPISNPPAGEGTGDGRAGQNSASSGVPGRAAARGTGGSATVGAGTVGSGTTATGTTATGAPGSGGAAGASAGGARAR